MKILELQAENVKRLSAVEIKPDGAVVKIAGKNAAGKSSVLDSIAYALGGKSLIPGEPLRRGEKKGHVTVTLDGDLINDIPPLTITRTFSDKGTTSLKVTTTAKGMKPGSPQALLDSLCGRIAFDPLEFTRMAPAKQAETLRGLVGLDFTDLDGRRRGIFDERTAVNREAKAVRARLDAAEHFPDAPAEEVSATDLVQELQRRQEVNRENAKERRVLADHEAQNKNLWGSVAHHKARIAEIEEQLETERSSFKQWTGQADQSDLDLANHRESVAARKEADTADVERQISESQTVNSQVRANAVRAENIVDRDALEAKATALTEQIATLDADKQDQLKAADWPVEGLGFGEDGITFDGLPFEQASSAEQVRVSMATALAMNPTLRVLLIRDASLLDDDSMRLVAEMAAKADAQVWLECVGENDECAVVIENGQVKETNTKENQ